MQEIILIIYLVVSIALIGIILLQQGKGAEMGASFGAGGANTVFGAAGSGNVLTKTTTILAILFFATALTISYINSETAVVEDVILDEVSTQSKQEVESIEAELPTSSDALESQVAPDESAVSENVEITTENSENKDETPEVVKEEKPQS